MAKEQKFKVTLVDGTVLPTITNVSSSPIERAQDIARMLLMSKTLIAGAKIQRISK